MNPDMTNRLQDAEITGSANPSAPPATIGSLISESLFQVMWRHNWIVIGTTVIALVAGFIYLSKATPIYTSTSRLYVEQVGPKIMQDLQQGVMTGSTKYLYTQAELLKATPIVADAITKCGARQMRTFVKVDNLIEYLKRSLDTTVGKKDDIVSISFDSPYPTEAAQLVNTLQTNRHANWN